MTLYDTIIERPWQIHVAVPGRQEDKSKHQG